MKNLSLFLTFGVVTLMGACGAVNSGTPTSEENPATDSSVIIELEEEPTAEGVEFEEEPTAEGVEFEEEPTAEGVEFEEEPTAEGVEFEEEPTAEGLEDPTLEPEMEEIPVVEGSTDSELAEEYPEADTLETIEPNDGDIILPSENVEIPTEEEAAEGVELEEAPAE